MPDDTFREISTEVLSDDYGVLTRHRFALRLSDGTWDEQSREVYERGSGATALLHDPKADTVLLVRQFRLPLRVAGRDPMMIETPAGNLDGADPGARVAAELLEETGFQALTIEHVASLSMTPASATQIMACYLGTYDRTAPVAPGGGERDEGEDITVLHVPLPEALAMVRDGRIIDGKACFLISQLALRRAGL